jgi:hypothetical protein
VQGAAITVSLEVTNSGGARVSSITSQLMLGGDGSAVARSGPTPSLFDLDPGQRRTIVWVYDASAIGTITFSGRAAGVDANSGAPVASSSASAMVMVMRHAALSLALSLPSTVDVNGTFTVDLDVTNGGGGGALDVAPSTPTLSGSAAAMLLTGPTPPSFAGPLVAGATQRFQWTYRATSAGTLTISVDVTARDENDGSLVAASASGGTTVGTLGRLAATLVLPSHITRGVSFPVRLDVTNVGSANVEGVAPSGLATSGVAATVLSGPTPASATLEPSGTASFVWSVRADTNGSLTIDGSVSGTDSTAMQPVGTTFRGSTTVGEVTLLASDPFGDGASFSYVLAHDGRVWLGPRANGTGAVRMAPDGSSPESITFSFLRDANGNASSNISSPPYPSIGAPGCVANTANCGPDNENGRGLFGSGVVAGVPWLVLGGARPSAQLEYVYLTPDTGTTVTFRYADLSAVLGANTHTFSAMHLFGGRLYLGFSDTGGNKPYLVALTTMPSSPGLDEMYGGSQSPDIVSCMSMFLASIVRSFEYIAWTSSLAISHPSEEIVLVATS